MNSRTSILLGLLIAMPAYGKVLVRSEAPGFTLKDSQKHSHSLADYKGHVVLVNFWASWCAPCQQELPELNRLAIAYENKKVSILTINVDKIPQDARSLLARLQLSDPRFDILWDTKARVVERYDIETMPSSFVLDVHGVVYAVHAGFHPQDPALWRREIDALLR